MMDNAKYSSDWLLLNSTLVTLTFFYLGVLKKIPIAPGSSSMPASSWIRQQKKIANCLFKTTPQLEIVLAFFCLTPWKPFFSICPKQILRLCFWDLHSSHQYHGLKDTNPHTDAHRGIFIVKCPGIERREELGFKRSVF